MVRAYERLISIQAEQWERGDSFDLPYLAKAAYLTPCVGSSRGGPAAPLAYLSSLVDRPEHNALIREPERFADAVLSLDTCEDVGALLSRHLG